MTTWILWLWVPFWLHSATVPSPASAWTSLCFLPQHLHDATFSSDQWLHCACLLHCLPFLPSFTFPLHPTVLWFHHSLYRDCSFFSSKSQPMTYFYQTQWLLQSLDNFDHHSFLFSLSFWLSDSTVPSPSSVSEMLAVTWLVNIWQLYPEGKKQQTNKHTPLMCNAFWFLWCRYSHRGPWFHFKWPTWNHWMQNWEEMWTVISSTDLSQLQHTTNSLSSFISCSSKIGVLLVWFPSWSACIPWVLQDNLLECESSILEIILNFIFVFKCLSYLGFIM